MSGAENRLRYALSDVRHEEIFRDRVLGEYIPARISLPDQPTAVIVGGQPGAGKSQALLTASAKLQDSGTTVVINGDDFRVYHPDYARLQRDHPERAAFYTDRDSGRWVEKTIAEASRLRVNVVIESTMRDPAVFERTATALRKAGYQVEARAVAVSDAESWQGVNLRYEIMKARGEVGRWTLREAHDAGYRGVPMTLARIEGQQLADRVVVVDRRGAVLYENTENGRGGWRQPPQAASVLEAERNRPRSAGEIASFDKVWRSITELQAARGVEANQVAGMLSAAPRLPGREGLTTDTEQSRMAGQVQVQRQDGLSDKAAAASALKHSAGSYWDSIASAGKQQGPSDAAPSMDRTKGPRR